MNFILKKPTNLDLHLIREFYVNWDPRDLYSKVKIHKQVVTFNTYDLNAILGSSNANSLQLR